MTRPGLADATLPELRHILEKAREKNYRAGVLGVRARPTVPDPAAFDHHGVPVTVVACESTLAIREALLDRDPDGWLVVLTDREPAELGPGLLGRMVGHTLRRPDPWDVVRQRFAAAGIDPALTIGEHRRERAAGLVAATPAGGWPPAPGGVLTRDHALAAVARARLGLGADGLEVDAATVLHWSTTPEVATRIADLRSLAGDPLTDAVLDWAAGRTGAAAPALRRLLAAGAVGDALPLGLVVSLLTATGDAGDPDRAQLARDARIRLEARIGAAARDLLALRTWGEEARAVAGDLLHPDAQGPSGAVRLLGRADSMLDSLAAGALAAGSDLLPAGLTTRLARLGLRLRAAAVPAGDVMAGDGATGPVDRPLVAPAGLAAVEESWEDVERHQLAAGDRRRAAAHAAVRLVRWLAGDTAAEPVLPALVARHRDADGWVDAAVAAATAGVADPGLGAGLSAVLGAVRRRRDAHDRAFAAALATHTRDEPTPAGVRHLEDLLPEAVLPLTRKAPVLLLVMDGMSVAVATEMITDILADPAGWAEALLPRESARAAALAVLPTLTDVSRTSLLCGELRTGQQEQERRGHAALVRAYGLGEPALFHKRALDTSQPGFALSDEVAAAVDDTAGRPLVTCVLNAIDDALDRSDPGGTQWDQDAVRHLQPLLDRAHRRGRVVVLTSDHGHVLERRAGTQRPYPGTSSGRSRPGDGPAPGEDEVLVAGRRVLRHDHLAVLAVDERLRYGPLKAGYHGGASPAEAVVPVCVLVPSSVPDGTGLREVGPQEPGWWYGPVAPPPAAPTAEPTLFDGGAPPAPAGDAVAGAVLGSRAYRAQREIAGRVALTDDQVRALLVALLGAGRRLRPPRAAAALGVAPAMLRGAVAQAIRLLNVEGYPVLGLDPDGETLVLDEPLLREQFEVPAP